MFSVTAVGEVRQSSIADESADPFQHTWLGALCWTYARKEKLVGVDLDDKDSAALGVSVVLRETIVSDNQRHSPFLHMRFLMMRVWPACRAQMSHAGSYGICVRLFFSR